MSFASVAETFDVTAVVLLRAVIGCPFANPIYALCSKCLLDSSGGNCYSLTLCCTVILRSVRALKAVIAPASSSRSCWSSSVSESESDIIRTLLSLCRSSFIVFDLYSVGILGLSMDFIVCNVNSAS